MMFIMPRRCCCISSTMTVDVDSQKGFAFSAIDGAIICQKKNHMQVSLHFRVSGRPAYLQVHEGTILPISRFHVDIVGLKTETGVGSSPPAAATGGSDIVQIEQSTADRTRAVFEGCPFELPPKASQLCVKVARLHFSETTANNVRRKGRPNPDQRYFWLRVTVSAIAQKEGATQKYPVLQQTSGRIIVRASNPAQFEGEGELHWVQGHGATDVVHRGQVGINTDAPTESLVWIIHGSVVTAYYYHLMP